MSPGAAAAARCRAGLTALRIAGGDVRHEGTTPTSSGDDGRISRRTTDQAQEAGNTVSGTPVPAGPVRQRLRGRLASLLPQAQHRARGTQTANGFRPSPTGLVRTLLEQDLTQEVTFEKPSRASTTGLDHLRCIEVAWS